MNKQLLSIIIPSRDPRYLQKTIDDLLSKAEGEVEIIVVLDGIWHDPMPKSDPRVIIVHHGTQFNNVGMRDSINRGMAISKGTHVMKIDEHCLMSQGYDLALKADCEDEDVIIPRRYRIDPDKWEIIEDGRASIDYMHIDFPFQRPNDKSCGLHGGIWKRPGREKILIDETPSMQGSFYFMKKSYWDKLIGPLDSEKYGDFTQEAQEISCKAWFSGGRVMVNKNVYYAHWHKGTKGKGYGFSTAQYDEHGKSMNKGRIYCRDYWLTTKDYKYDWEWYMKKFPDMPGWGSDWKERIVEARKIEDELLISQVINK